MWAFIVKWGMRAFSVVKDNRTIQVGLMIGLILFMDWQNDLRDRKIDSLRKEVAALETEIKLNRKAVEAKEFTHTITERVIERERIVHEQVEDIIDDIENAPETENDTLPELSRSTNRRINCLLYPETCDADQGDIAGDSGEAPDLP